MSNPRRRAAILAQDSVFSKKIMQQFGLTDELAIKYGQPARKITPENAGTVVKKHLSSVGKEIGDVYSSLTPINQPKPTPLMIENKGLAPPVDATPPVDTGMPTQPNKFLEALLGSQKNDVPPSGGVVPPAVGGKEVLSPDEIEAINRNIDAYRYGLEKYKDNPDQVARIQADLDEAVARLNNAQKPPSSGGVVPPTNQGDIDFYKDLVSKERDPRLKATFQRLLDEEISKSNQAAPPLSGGVVPPAAPSNAIDVNIVNKLSDGFPGMAPYSPDSNISIGDYIKDVRSEAGEIVSKKSDKFGISYRTRAKALIDYIDSTVREAIGDKEFERLESLNEQYSKFKTLEDALGNAASKGRTGIITPRDVIDADHTRYTGKIEEAADLADKYLRRNNMVPTPENRRKAMEIILGSISGAGLGSASQLGMLGAGIPTALTTGALVATGAAGGASVAAALRAIRNSKVIEAAERRRALYQPINPAIVSAGPAATVAGERQERKSGGRVDSHEAEADRLVMAAERAKKGLSAHTEGLLNTSDDAVASALEIANRSI
jgi:hypothetical protein